MNSGGALVSCAYLTVNRDELWLDQIITPSSYQRRGYATALIKEIIANPPRLRRWLRLNILPIGNRALSVEQLQLFYLKRGFKMTTKTRHGGQVWEMKIQK